MCKMPNCEGKTGYVAGLTELFQSITIDNSKTTVHLEKFIDWAKSYFSDDFLQREFLSDQLLYECFIKSKNHVISQYPLH